MNKNIPYYFLLAVIFAVIIYSEPVFGIILIPAFIALFIAAESIRKGNLPKDIDSYKVLWKDSLKKEKAASKDVRHPSITLYDCGIGYSNYFVQYKDIIKIKHAGPSIQRSWVARILAPLAKVRIGDNRYSFMKIVAKNRVVIFEVADFAGFKKELKKIGKENLIDDTVK